MSWLRKLAQTLHTVFKVATRRKQTLPSQQEIQPEELEQAVQLVTAMIGLPSNDSPSQKSYERFHHLAGLLLESYEESRSTETLEESIQLYERTMSLYPQSVVGHDDVLFGLAYALRQRYQCQGSTVDLQECIKRFQQSLDVRPTGHPARASSLNNLGNALGDRYARYGGEDDLRQQIELYTESLELNPPGHPLRNITLINLGNALGYRYARYGGEDDLKLMIELYTESLGLCLPGHPTRASSLGSLANALGDRYAHYGGEEDLKQRIELYTETLELCIPGHPAREITLNNLGNALGDRYARYGGEDDLKQMVELYTESLGLRPPGHPFRASSLIALGTALGDRYARYGGEDDLNQRIELYAESLNLRPPGHPTRASSLGSLANALGDRYARYGEEDDLRQRIELYTESLKLSPPGHPGRTSSLINLGNALDDRYMRYGGEDDLKQQIELYIESLELNPPGHPFRDTTLNNLGSALANRYECYGGEDDLKQMIELYTESLSLRPPGHPLRDVTLNNLGNALGVRCTRYGGEDDLNQRIELYTESLSLRPPGHPTRASSLISLGNALGGRYIRHGYEDDLNKAIKLLEGEVDGAFSTESGMLRCALKWVDMAERFSHDSLGRAFVKTIGSLRRFLSIGPTAELQYKAILQQSRLASLSIDAAAYFIEKEDITQTIELLDEGRSLLWSEMRRFRESLTSQEREMLGEDLSSRYLDLCRVLSTLANSEVTFETFSSSATSKEEQSGSTSKVAYGKLLNEKRVKLEEYSVFLSQIRQIPGCEDFQRPSKFARLKQAAEEGPVVVINCSRRRSDVIILFSRRSPLHIQLDEDFFQIMQHTSECYLSRLSELNTASDIVRTISELLEPVVEQLWINVVEHVVEALQDNGIERGSRIWWCPTSFLSFLPFHAAGNGSEWLIDYYVSSYTPTLGALISARQEVVQDPSPPRIVVVSQTKTSGLKNAEPELREMQKLASFQACLDEEDATPQSVDKHLPSYDWAHFICHGTVSDNPFDSHLHLHDRSKFTLNDIIKLHMGDAKFAFLAACHSAAQSRDRTVLRDEILHLAAAMHVSGFRSVVGTMWQMEDGDGPLIARKFYEEIFKGECGGEGRHTLAARALWKAVRWLKDESMREVEEGCGETRQKRQRGEGKEEGKETEKKGKGKKVTKRKKKQEFPLARWANYIHIGA